MEPSKVNYYSVLGVSASADISEIKKRYRALSKSYHPDTPGGDSAKMILLNEAYSVLSDPDKRYFYEPPAPKHAPTAVKKPVRTSAYEAKPQRQRPVHRAQQTVYYEEEPKNTLAHILSYVLAVPIALIIFAFGYPHLQQFIPKAPEVSAWPLTSPEPTVTNTVEPPTSTKSQPATPAKAQVPTLQTKPAQRSTTNPELNQNIRYKYYTNQ